MTQLDRNVLLSIAGMDEVELAEAVVEAASPCFNATDREFVRNDLAAGEFLYAIDGALTAAAREGQPVPADILDQVRRAADGSPIERRMQGHLDQLLALAS